MLPMAIFVLFNLLIDSYIYRALKRRCKAKWPAVVQWWSAAVLYMVVLGVLALPFKSGSNQTLLAVMWTVFGYFSIYIPKYLFVIFDLLARVPKLFGRRRLKWLSLTGAVVSCVVFILFWWGALINRFRLDVKEVEIPMAGLPAQFDGYRIVQLSDLHTGTYGNDTTFVSRLVDEVNRLDADLIAFTGDIVNRRSDELTPFVRPLSRLRARDGVISILGNHDYGDYAVWASDSLKQENMQLLLDMQRDMHWDLLLNDTRFIRRGESDSIAIIGVENIGDPPFHVYGSLPKAYPNTGDSVVKILLSHNPAHWTDDISNHSEHNIGLTLSGHTHAMQMSAGRISPAVFRYPTWGGLYADADSTHLLYVNIGEGTVGMPARIGATPEITLITLKKK